MPLVLFIHSNGSLPKEEEGTQGKTLMFTFAYSAKNAATPKTKQVKMPEAEFVEKFSPIAFAQQSLTDFELPPLHQTTRGFETEDFSKVVLPFPTTPLTDPTTVNNVKWRNGLGNLVLTF